MEKEVTQARFWWALVFAWVPLIPWLPRILGITAAFSGLTQRKATWLTATAHDPLFLTCVALTIILEIIAIVLLLDTISIAHRIRSTIAVLSIFVSASMVLLFGLFSCALGPGPCVL